MATAWSDLLTTAAMPFIDDIRWTEQLELSPALFFRAKSMLVTLAMPLLSRPPELFTYLSDGLVGAMYGDAEWVSTDESLVQPTVIPTDYVGYDIMSVIIRNVDEYGNVDEQPYNDATYDAETGEVTFPVQTTAGVTYCLDFYKDGYFTNDLTVSMRRLMGLAIACVWDERFSRNWLNMQMKLHDSSFDVVNEANYIEKVTNRLVANRQSLNDELRKYEQDVAYQNIVLQHNKHKVLI